VTVLQGAQSGGGGNAPNSILAEDEETNVSANTLTTVVSYTAAEIKRIHSVLCSGCTYAKFTCVLNTVTIATKRTGPQRNTDFYLNIEIGVGDVFEIKVEHFQTSVGDAVFEGTILGF
jgi:hypothetical protein